ncbi:MAG: ATP-binding protein [Paludibacteraceae bacterium]|nr:ATP-binding protein [Paludibacteraceae bacterium]
MLVDFSVENFLSFKDRQTLSFEPDAKIKGLEDYYFISVRDKDSQKKPLQLLKIGMIYGANASGKSNLLKALNHMKFIATKTQTEKNVPLKFIPFGMDYSGKSAMEVNFISEQTKYNYIVEFNANSIIYEELNEYPFLTAKKSKNVYKRTTDKEKRLPNIVFDKGQKVDSLTQKQLGLITLSNETVLAGFSKISADISALRNACDWFNEKLDMLLSLQIPLHMIAADYIDNHSIMSKSMVSALKRADFNISDISIDKKRTEKEYMQEELDSYVEGHKLTINVDGEEVGNSNDIPKIIIKHKTDQTEFVLPDRLESEGTMRYFGLMGILLHLSDSDGLFMMIDELDTSLHPELYNSFIISFLKNVKNSQLLFTTHNREFLQKKRILRKDALWIANKRSDGSTEMYSFSDFDSSVIRDTSSIYNAYSVGKLGGVPKNADDLMLFIEK